MGNIGVTPLSLFYFFLFLFFHCLSFNDSSLGSVPLYLHIYKEIANTLKWKTNSLGFRSVSEFKTVLENPQGSFAHLEFLTFTCLVW